MLLKYISRLLALVVVVMRPVEAQGSNGGSSPPQPPSWPSAYEMAFTTTFSTSITYLPNGFKTPVHVWYQQIKIVNPKTGQFGIIGAQMRMEAFGGRNIYIGNLTRNTTVNPDVEYVVLPQIDKKACLKYTNRPITNAK
ncbi:hypothetical protein Vretifemale_749, partial [Volvox reticuliferus]